eukprot:3817382-Prymnesium_polylepis.1
MELGHAGGLGHALSQAGPVCTVRSRTRCAGQGPSLRWSCVPSAIAWRAPFASTGVEWVSFPHGARTRPRRARGVSPASSEAALRLARSR